MTVLEENGIRVEAATPAAAVRALKKERARQESAARLANERAYGTLGWIVSCARAMGEKMTDAQFRARVTISETNPRQMSVRVSSARSNEPSEASVDFYGFRPLAIWERANGETTVIDTEDMDSGDAHAYVVGIADGRTSIVEVPAYVAHRLVTGDA